MIMLKVTSKTISCISVSNSSEIRNSEVDGATEKTVADIKLENDALRMQIANVSTAMPIRYFHFFSQTFSFIPYYFISIMFYFCFQRLIVTYIVYFCFYKLHW